VLAFPSTKVLDALANLIEDMWRALKREKRGTNSRHKVRAFSRRTGQTSSEVMLECNYKIIGAGYTPVRAIIDRAAGLIDRPTACFALVVTHEGLAELFFGSPQEAWKAAAALSAQKHVIYVQKPFRRVLSVMPRLYDYLWTGAKGCIKWNQRLPTEARW
jgi:nickel-dependent lactate racemase